MAKAPRREPQEARMKPGRARRPTVRSEVWGNRWTTGRRAMLRTEGRRLIALVGMIAIGTAACGGHKASPLPRPAPPATSTTSTTLDPNHQVIADLQAYYDTYYRVAAAPDPGDPGIAEHMTGGQLIAFRGFIEGLVHDGEAARGSSVDRRFG